jgi:hypothetical protein
VAKLLKSKSTSRKYIIACIAVALVLALIISVFVLQQLASQDQVINQKDTIQSDTSSPLDATTPTTTDEPTPTPTPTTTPSPTIIPVPIDFTCNSGSPYAFTVTAAVDLNDGMNQAEAITVAEAIFNHEMTNATYEVKSANASDAGTWTVYLLWGAVSPDGYHESHSHFFNVVANPLDRTVTYSRCY